MAEEARARALELRKQLFPDYNSTTDICPRCGVVRWNGRDWSKEKGAGCCICGIFHGHWRTARRASPCGTGCVFK